MKESKTGTKLTSINTPKSAIQLRKERLLKWKQTQVSDSLSTAVTEEGRKGEEEGEREKKREKEEEEEDPLDAYMIGIQAEVKQLLPLPSSLSSKPSLSFSLSQSQTQTEKGESLLGERYYSDEEITTRLEDLEQEEEREREREREGDDVPSLFRKKHVMERVNHESVDYMQFRKCFYQEVPEISNLTPEEVAIRRSDMGHIIVKGKDAPNPISHFHQCGLSRGILSLCEKLKYEKPTPIQAQAIPALMQGRDIIGIAKTGSGKTLAFLLPLLRHVIDQPPVKQGEGMIGLIMVPARELALQIHSEAKKFCKRLNIHSVCIYGGVGVPQQIGDLKRGSEIVVATPGRLIDILATNSGKVTNLKRCTFLVLDEADRMYDLGFEPQISRIIENIRPDRQTALFSATFPRSIEHIARKILKNPLEVVVGERSVVCSDVTQLVEVREKDTKFARLLELLDVWTQRGQVLVFVDRQQTCDILWEELLKNGYKGLPLHGGVDQTDRHSFIEQFKKGEVNVLVATSVAARGLDVKGLNCVINYDAPNHLEDYVHRAGRTGRAGAKGTAVTFLTPEQLSYAPEIMKALKDAKQEVPSDLVDMVKQYKALKKEGKAKSHGSGFGGRGFKFNEEEEEQAVASLSLQKLAYGVVDDLEDDDDDEEDEMGATMEKKLQKIAKNLGMSEEEAAKISTRFAEEEKKEANEIPSELLEAFGTSAPNITWAPTPSTSSAALQAIQQVTASSSSSLSSLSSSSLSSSLSGGAKKINHLEAKKRVQLLAAAFNMQANARSAKDPNAPKISEFSRELEINDFPQQARWKVTHKEAVSSITEWTGCSLTTKGVFYPPGKSPKPGEERKLYLLIEGDSEEAVVNARKEIKRILLDASAMSHQERSQAPVGKYSITFQG